MSVVLTTNEQRDFDLYEGIVQSGIDTFVEVGRALAEIRDRRLYRAEHDTFEDYCRERWELGRTRAYQLISAAEVSRAMSTNGGHGEHLPANERQARELTPLLREDERQAVEVWRDLTEAHGDKVTAAKVREAVTEKLARDDKVPCPHCHRLVRRTRPHRCPATPTTTVVTEITSERQRQVAQKAKDRLCTLVGHMSALQRTDDGLASALRVHKIVAISEIEEIIGYIEVLAGGERAIRELRQELTKAAAARNGGPS
jgi:hypothetical protein